MIVVTLFKEAREKRGLSQSKLARLARVSQQLIGAIESGRIKQTKSIYRIADALQVPASQLDPEIPELGSEFEEQLIQIREMSPEDSAFILRGLKDLIKMARRKPKLVVTDNDSPPQPGQPTGRKIVR